MFDKLLFIWYYNTARCIMSNYKNKETEVLGYIRSYLSDNGFPPTVREVCQAMGFSSSATGQYYINKLKKMGLIANKESRNRAISLLGEKQEIAMVPIIGTVTAGTPIMAVENFDGYFPLPEEFKPDEDTFILTVRGNSMINAGILNGDKIIVKKSSSADNGDIVVAFWDDSATCKRFFRRNGHIVLHPENDELSDIVLNDVSIIGIVCGLIRRFK